jgi:hypothetical protein
MTTGQTGPGELRVMSQFGCLPRQRSGMFLALRVFQDTLG